MNLGFSAFWEREIKLDEICTHLILIPRQVKSFVLWKSHSRVRGCVRSKQVTYEERDLAERITVLAVREAITRRPDSLNPWRERESSRGELYIA